LPRLAHPPAIGFGWTRLLLVKLLIGNRQVNSEYSLLLRFAYSGEKWEELQGGGERSEKKKFFLYSMIPHETLSNR